MRSRTIRSLSVAGAAALLAAVAPMLGALPMVSAAEPDDSVPARAERQIEALAVAKASRTPVEQKIDSPLLTASQLSRGQALPSGVRVKAPVPVDRAGRVEVEIRGRVTPAVRQRVAALGGLVRYESAADRVMRADVPVVALTRLAALRQVDRVVSLASTPVTATVQDPRVRTGPLSKEQLGAALAAARESRAAGQVASATGSVVSEGDSTHGADVARTQRRLSGVGVTVGVLSDGVDSLPVSIDSGDLPADVEVLPEAAGSGDEGTAMLEIVHDLAPRARLAFATGLDGEQSFADNIRALRAAGADIIVDDVLYYSESPFQDGPIATAAPEVSRDGALYFSSAGNEGNADDGTSGNYEGDFRGADETAFKFAGEAHDFDPGPDVQASDPTTAASAGVPTILQWANPYGAAVDDYDLYAVDREGNVAAFSNDVQDGDDDPFEGFILPETGGPTRLVVMKYRGAGRYFQLTAFRGRFADDGAVKAYATPGVTRGHSTVPAAVSVAAVPAATPLPFDLEEGDPLNPAGPFPGRFDDEQLSERFTADGPRRVFFTAGGRALTPGNLSSTGGRVRARPTLSAADGVSTSLEGFSPFFGTSAAAPHAAAMAALALSGRPGLRPAALRAAMTGTAIDIEQPGRDRDTGRGIIDAPALLADVGATGQPYLSAGDLVVTASSDGDNFLEPGEGGSVSLPVTSVGDVAAPGVSVTLDSSTPGVTVSPVHQEYGDIAVGASAGRTFQVTIPRSTRLGTQVVLRVTMRFRGRGSPQVSQVGVEVGEPAATAVRSAYSGPPVAVPDADPEGASVTLPVSGVGAVSDVTFSIDGTTCTADEGSDTVGLDHSYVSDLTGTLTGPDGTTITLFDRVGSQGVNFCQVEITDAADRPIQFARDVDQPFTGSWRPAVALDAFSGRTGDGPWRFTAVDNALDDTGMIRAVSVQVRGFAAPPP